MIGLLSNSKISDPTLILFTLGCVVLLGHPNHSFIVCKFLMTRDLPMELIATVSAYNDREAQLIAENRRTFVQRPAFIAEDANSEG